MVKQALVFSTDCHKQRKSPGAVLKSEVVPLFPLFFLCKDYLLAPSQVFKPPSVGEAVVDGGGGGGGAVADGGSTIDDEDDD